MQLKPQEAIGQLRKLREEIVQSLMNGDESKLEQYRAQFKSITGRQPQ